MANEVKYFSAEQLINAQQKWNNDLLDNPDKYDVNEPTDGEDYAERQINTLIDFVQEKNDLKALLEEHNLVLIEYNKNHKTMKTVDVIDLLHRIIKLL